MKTICRRTLRVVMVVTMLLLVLLVNAGDKEKFLRDIKKSLHSFKELHKVLNQYRGDNKTNWVQPGSKFFGCKSWFHSFVFENTNVDTVKCEDGKRRVTRPVMAINVRIYHQDDKIVYLSFVKEGEWYQCKTKDDTIFRYIDEDFSRKILTSYNSAHQTSFTWRDLYEDQEDRFYIVPGIGGGLDMTTWNLKYVPLIRKKNYGAIEAECKSFNPVRRAYGALALYGLNYLGEKLSHKQRMMMDDICREKTIIHYSYGCSGYDISLSEAVKESMTVITGKGFASVCDIN